MKKIILIITLLSSNMFANANYISAMGGSCPNGGVYRADYLGFYKCECTSYVAWKVSEEGTKLRNHGLEVNGEWKNIGSYYSSVDKQYKSRFSHAHNWDDAAETINVPVDNNPRVGDIAVWDSGSYGHVAYVESVNSDNSVNISEYNQKYKHKFSKRYSVRADHYIHVKSNSSTDITRSKSLKMILDKFSISTQNAGFNKSRFGVGISLPNDVTSSTSNYDSIVVGYNRGIVNGSNGKFYPKNTVSLQEFLTMIVRTIPIPLTNPNYKEYDYMSSGDGFYKYVKTAYNAKIIENIDNDVSGSIDQSTAEQLLNKAFEYFRGTNSGISVYLKWTQKYADLDMYVFSEYEAEGITMDTDSNDIVTNMSVLKASKGIVYWNKYSSTWGANLDYDSWGGHGSQPWVGFGEERITVDSLMVRRPGKYSFIICNYNWSGVTNASNPSYELTGYKGSINITSGGVITGNIDKGECRLGGTLTTR